MQTRRQVSPPEWIALMAGAQFVVTNSFHGAAFALNFNIPFAIELLPERHCVNSRVRNLMQMAGIPAVSTSRGHYELVDGWDGVNDSLVEARLRSLEILKRAVSDDEEDMNGG